MRREIIIKGASFTGTSDLTIVAPIRKGFVPSLDAVTYKTRVKRVLKALHLGRQTAHEYDLARVMSDAVERVGRIHSIRIAIIESENRVTPEDKVVLAVTFDGSWESYIRVIWQKVARSLDLIFCNTEGYVTGWGHSFEEWCVWLRAHHAEAPFLYSTPNLSYQDTQYLRMFERRHRVVLDPRDPEELGKTDLASTLIRIPSAEEISKQQGKDGTDPTNLFLDRPVDAQEAGRPAFRQGMRGLAGLYRLAELHLPGTPDGDILHRATVELLREFAPMICTEEGRSKYEEAIALAEVRFLDAMNWLRFTRSFDRTIPCLPNSPDQSEYADVQGGIIDGYPGVSDGCLLLLAFDSSLELGGFLAKVEPTSATAVQKEGEITVNIALSLQGMRLAGLSDDEIASLPAEFVQGMEQRAGMLGDVRINHPRRWRLPALNSEQGVDAADVSQDDPSPRVDLSTVHLVLQLRLCNSKLPEREARMRLLQKYAELNSGLGTDLAPPRLLSIQWMRHLKTEKGKSREHFGFLDGQSQPVLKDSEAGKKFPNQIHLGEILLGHDNAADTVPKTSDASKMQKLLRNGSFLVIRKLRQDVAALEHVLAIAAKDTLPEDAADDALKKQRLQLLGKMVGRWPIGHDHEGQALAEATPGNENDFNFRFDPVGETCPIHAHIRRANPRDITKPEPLGARPARLIRRGMSYGPMHDPEASDEAKAKSLLQERGLIFMAYNTSIGEQFEVVQRWLTGGNSSGSYSGQSDPLLGIAEPGRPRYFRFEQDGGTVRMALDGSNRLHDEPRPFVRLEWGMYLFAPALSALKKLAARATDSGKVLAKSWSIDAGEKEIDRLRRIESVQGANAAMEAWKAAIEDPSSAVEFTAASIWAAIRANYGGVLDTPFGVLVASRDLVDHVLNDRARNLTATGYLPRMQRSFGTLYLGLDSGQYDGVYERESEKVNAVIMDLVANKEDFSAAVAEAAAVTQRALEALVAGARKQAVSQCEPHWELTFEAREVIDEVLAHFCEKWFGLSQNGGFLKKSGMRWIWKEDEPPCYPGHFMAPSRFTFQPHPGPEVENIGSRHGIALRCAITKYLKAFGPSLTAPVARAALDCGAKLNDATYPARTLAGVLMGFLPTTDGNMRRVLNEWLNEGTLWTLRAQSQMTRKKEAEGSETLSPKILEKFVEAMQLRAAPELLWRTVAHSHEIGKAGQNTVAVRPGQIVIASLISATQECLELGIHSVDYAFGGKRERGKPHPTHACPGYGPATAVMYGFFKGLVESDLPLRPGPAALSMSMTGTVELPDTCPSAVTAPTLARSGFNGPAPVEPTMEVAQFGLHAARPKAIPILAIGDSWLVKYLALASSLTNGLNDLNFKCDDTYTAIGRPLATMANKELLDDIAIYLASFSSAKAPRAILIGGGGNDLVNPSGKPRESRLFKMLKKERATSADEALDGVVAGAFIDGVLAGYYRTILDSVTQATSAPIFIHAYDHPFADGEPTGHGQGPWLKPIFDEMKIDQPVSNEVMYVLIEWLNRMIDEVIKAYPNRVKRLELNGRLAKEPDFAGNYRKYWANELHASDVGFGVLAQFVKSELGGL